MEFPEHRGGCFKLEFNYLWEGHDWFIKEMEHLDHTLPPISMMSKWRVFVPLQLHHCFGGKGGWLFLFILSKIAELFTYERVLSGEGVGWLLGMGHLFIFEQVLILLPFSVVVFEWWGTTECFFLCVK